MSRRDKNWPIYYNASTLIIPAKLIIQVFKINIIIEFIAATMDQSQYMKTDKLHATFKMLDLDGNGKIDKNELKS